MHKQSLQFSRFILGACALVAAANAVAQTQQSPVTERPAIQPQVDIAGTGIATIDLGRNGAFGSNGMSTGSQINFSDSDLALGFSQRMYRGGIGSFTLGGLSTDESNSGSNFQLFVHEAFLDFQNLHTEAYLGRTDNPSAQLVQFPTLRGDDLVDFTYLLDPFSDGRNIEEHRYANVAAVTFNQKLRTFENVHVQHLIDSAGLGGAGNSAINSYGAAYQYMALPTQEPLARVVSYGLGYEHRAIPSGFGGSSEALYGGGVFNLTPGITRRIDLRLLDSLTFGNSTNGFETLNDTYRADGNAIAASLEYLRTPFGLPASRLSLTAGYKSFSKISSANEFGLALTGSHRLGEGFDAVAQLGYMHRSRSLAAVYNGHQDDVTLQLGLTFNFDAEFNESVGPRRTPLNTIYRHISD